MHPRQALFLLNFFLLGFVSFGAAFGGSPDLARQNLLLRDYFRQLALGVVPGTVEFHAPNYSPGKDPYLASRLESRVDWLIGDFLVRLNRKMGALKTHFDDMVKMQEQLAAPSAAFESQGQRTRWKRSLRSVEDEADDLRNMLSFILVELHAKTDFKPQVRSRKDHVGFREELEFMSKQIAKAEQGIQDLFLAPTYEVDIRDITGENVMINLYRVRKMSEALRRRL